MKVLMIYPIMRDFHWYRYQNQIKAIAKHVDYLYLLYWKGYRPDRIDNIIFIKTKQNYPLRIWKRKPKFPIKTRNVALNIAKNLPDIDFDLIYVMSGSPVFQYMFKVIADYLKLPLVFRLRGDGIAEREVHYKSWWKKQLFKYYDLYVQRNSDLIIPITEEMRNKCLDRGFNNVSDVVPIGVDTDAFYLSHLPKEFTIGYFGRISKEKGIGFLLELMNETPGIKYIVAGEKQLKVDFPSNVEYLGVIKHPNMSQLYDRVSMILLPSDFEGLSNVILETYSKGRPIMLTPNALAKELPLFGWMEERDLNKWKNIIENADYVNLRNIGAEARSWMESNLSWEQFGRDIVNYFHEVIRTKTEWSKRTKELDTIWTRTEHIPEYRVKMINLISKELGENKEWSFIDAGCGTGLTYQYLPNELRDRYFGIDFTKEMIEYCKDKYGVDQFGVGNLLYPHEISEANLIITQNVIQHNDLWMFVLQNLIDKAKDVVIFCERSHDEFTVKVGEYPTRYVFGIGDFLRAMEYCGKGLWDKPIIIGHPKSTEGLENVLTIFMMRKRK